MPVTLRQRVDCHYCGRRSKQTQVKKKGGRFQCEHCLSVNFFDEDGEIADVPIDEVAPLQQYAQPIRSDPLADEFNVQDSIFCSTCLKNQHLYTYNLSQFLPDPEHPDFDKLEAELPAYKKALEERYPQCCARCEPKVKAQLQRATYNAQSDHLRRVLQKSRQRRISHRFGWRSLLVSAAGAGYLVSVVLQVLWHLYASQVSAQFVVDDVQLVHCFRTLTLDHRCLARLEPLVGLSLVLGLLCVWWNPKWQHKLSNGEGRLVKLHEYYLAQMAVLGLRFSAWAILSHTPLTLRNKSMLHAAFAIAIAVVVGSTLRIVKIRRNAPIDWQRDPAPLLNSRQYVPPQRHERQEQTRPVEQPFSVSSLAGPTTEVYSTPWMPPSPSRESGDSMDWTPSQPAFQPQLKNLRYRSTAPTPFRGTLPALNPKGVTRNQSQANGSQAMGIPPGFFDKPDSSALPAREDTYAREAMAQPRFFHRESDTGLENIFDSFFSLKDRSSGEEHPVQDPVAARPAQDIFQLARPHEAGQMLNDSAADNLFSRIAIAFLLLGISAWIFAGVVRPEPSDYGYWIILASSVIPTCHMVATVFSRTSRSLLPIVVYGIEVAVLIGVAQSRELFGTLLRDLWDKLAIALVALLLPQEFIALGQPPSLSSPLRQPPVQQQTRTTSTPRVQKPAPVDARTMAEKSRSLMPNLVRQISSDSDRSERSATTDTGPWETPRSQNSRFEYFDPSSRETHTAANTRANTRLNALPSANYSYSTTSARKPSAGSSEYGMNGLSLGLDDYPVSSERRTRGAKSRSSEEPNLPPRRRW